MGYLDIRKSKKSGKNTKIENIDIDKLIDKYGFKPSINQNDYLSFAFNNYEALIKEAMEFYKKEIQEKGVKIDNSYILKNTSDLDKLFKHDKEEYYKKLFIFEYLEQFK